jgi:hypothetical protein
MARKPNYQFERMERDRQKAAKVAAKAAAKRDERERETGASDPNPETKPSDEG